MSTERTRRGDWIELLSRMLADSPRLPGAACACHPELFDPPERGDDPQATAVRHERAIHRCPALADCRAWATTQRHRDPDVLGGLTLGQRERTHERNCA